MEEDAAVAAIRVAARAISVVCQPGMPSAAINRIAGWPVWAGVDAVVTTLWDGGSVADGATGRVGRGAEGLDEHGKPARLRRAVARAG